MWSTHLKGQDYLANCLRMFFLMCWLCYSCCLNCPSAWQICGLLTLLVCFVLHWRIGVLSCAEACRSLHHVWLEPMCEHNACCCFWSWCQSSWGLTSSLCWEINFWYWRKEAWQVIFRLRQGEQQIQALYSVRVSFRRYDTASLARRSLTPWQWAIIGPCVSMGPVIKYGT